MDATAPLPVEDQKALKNAAVIEAKLSQLALELGSDSPLASTIALLQQNLSNSTTYLADRQHTLAFLGSVGVGKTTAICHLLGLTLADGKPVLATSSGRTTLCEVVIRQDSATSLEIDPVTEEQMSCYLRDFADSLETRSPDLKRDREGGSMSVEVIRWLRNQLHLPKRTEQDPGTGQRRTIDEAKALLITLGNRETFLNELWDRLNYSSRDLLVLPAPEGTGLDWVQQTFADINHGKLPTSPMPARVTVRLSQLLFGIEGLAIDVVDTKGIDETVEREDLHSQARCPRTVTVVCTRFNDAPEANARAFFRQLKELGFSDRMTEECALLVLDRAGEAEDMMGPEGSVENADEGRNARFSQIEEALRTTLKLKSEAALFPICFYDSKAENSELSKRQLVANIARLRSTQRKNIGQVEEALQGILSEKERSATRAALNEVAFAVRSWIAESQKAQGNFGGFYKILVDQAGSANASSLQASVSRKGEWDNFDFYYRLAAAAQKRAVASFETSITELRAVLSNLGRQERHRPAFPFIRQLDTAAEPSAMRVYDTARRLGREMYETLWKADTGFWTQQSAEWGAGDGYRARVTRRTETWFGDSVIANREQLIQEAVMRAWRSLTNEIESHLVQEATA